MIIMTDNNDFKMVAKTFFGLEDVLSDELLTLGAKKIEKGVRNVSFFGDLGFLYKCNLSLRTAIRILKPIAFFNVNDEKELYSSFYNFNWEDFLSLDLTFSIESVLNSDFFSHSLFVSQKAKDGIVDRFRKLYKRRPNVDSIDPDIKINIHIRDNKCTVSLDSSGKPLNQRGYRSQTNIAPINEVLAAGIILLSDWDLESDFLDPMCGSGTFLIEAAMMAVNQPPGMKRTFGFQKLTSFDESLWKKIETEALHQMKPIEFLDIYGSDIDLRAVRVTRHNLKVAGLEEVAKVLQSDFVKLQPPTSEGVLVTNPPYGQRIGEDEDLKEVYPVWAKHMKESFGGWNTYFLTADLEMPKDMRLKPTKKTPLFNGALECRLFEIKMVSGSNRKPKD